MRAEVPREPAAGPGAHGDGLGVDRQALRGREGSARAAARASGKNCRSRSKRHTIAAERQERSRPLLDGFHAWLEAEAPKVLPKSDVRGAMDYTLNNWAALSVYTERAGWTSTTTKAKTRCGASAWDAGTGSSVGATAAAARRRSISACWPPASVTAMILGLPPRRAHPPARDVACGQAEELLALLPHRWRPA